MILQIILVRATAYERAIKIWEANLGAEHPQVATGVNNLGMVMQDLGDLNGARAAFERAIKIGKPISAQNIHKCHRLNNLGMVMQEPGRFERRTRRPSSAP